MTEVIDNLADDHGHPFWTTPSGQMVLQAYALGYYRGLANNPMLIDSEMSDQLIKLADRECPLEAILNVE